jgi:F-box and WD-40 domain protein 1/11
MWYDLALDRKLWERLYHLEGWKVIRSEIEASEAEVNALTSNGHLHRIQTEEGHTSKVRALSSEGDSDLEMTDSDRTLGASDGASVNSIFGSASSSFSSNRRGATPFGEIDLENLAKGKNNERGHTGSSTDSRGKRKEPGGDVVYSLPPILPAQDPNFLTRSSLWMWDANHSQHRINWKYLYNMRRKLESNWELGKFTTFQLPHPHHLDEGHTECVYAIQFDPHYLVSGSRDMTIRIWDLHSRRLLRAPLLGHTGSVLCLQFDSDPEEDLIVSGSSDSNVFIWKFSTGELVQKITNAHRESVLNVRFDKRILVTSSKDKTIKIFNRRPLRYGDLGYGAADMSFIVAKSVRQPGYEPDLAMELPVKPPFTMIGRLDGHNAAVNAIQVRDRTIVSVSGDRHIKVWDWPDQVCTKTIPAHEKGIACVEYDGRRIVSGSSDFDVCIFDAVTGVRVAQLHGHSYLVRTVQAGFGDLPYSKYEDEAEAKAIDAEFFKAQERGEIERNARRVRRSANAGSSRPSDIQAFGAKVPPDGGGGRKYGRIVSGSYDQKIIIWRRNKEGEWKPAHHLRQEEAAATARAAAALSARASRASASSHADTAMPPSVRQPAGTSNDHFVPLPTAIPADAIAQRSPAQLMAMIDQVVPLGLYALRVSLVTHPAILLHHGYLQNVIDRETSPYVRAQLRNAVADALLSVQNGQAAAGGPPVLASPPSITQQATPSSSTGGHAGSASTVSGSTNAPSNALNLTASASSTPAHQASSNTAQSIPPQPPAPTPAQAQLPVQTPLPTATPVPGIGAPPPRQPTHPHIPGDQGPARVFKLQFDARKIVCCSQAPVIVGWDFCNGDKELEEASRFFAPID